MSTLTTGSIASKRMARELWISLASLLRSHVEMRALATPASGLGVVVVSDLEVRMECGARTLRMMAPGVSGMGAIEFNALDQPQWYFFADDGRMCLDKADEEGMEMEAAVESLLDRMVR